MTVLRLSSRSFNIKSSPIREIQLWVELAKREALYRHYIYHVMFRSRIVANFVNVFLKYSIAHSNVYLPHVQAFL
jgi:hypothetical protein